MLTRRDFLSKVPAAAAAASSLYAVPLWAREEPNVDIPGEDRMIVRSARFLDLEMPPEFFDSWITPVPHFFVRNHMHEPAAIDLKHWRMTISGEVENPLTLSWKDLERMPAQTVTNTLECAGNGRAFHQPHVPGVQWQKGAVGNAQFAGPRLRDVLQRAGVKPTGKHVMFHGLDEVPGKVPPFIRSIPIEKALDGNTLVATKMNGRALSKHHGFPARAMVPGWIGAASCKWLGEIKVLDKEFDGNFMKPGYRIPNHPLKPGEPLNIDDSHVLTSLNVKSVISSPADQTTIKFKAQQVRGAAWAGEAEIVRVEVSTDGGTSWEDAQLGREQAKYAWRLWSYLWNVPKSGEYTIMSRATDSQGRVQPASVDWNPSGYFYNAIDQVKVNVQV
ncbi:MAG: sulfite oxidase [Acidobacteriaceae bacterium]|nr:sulfite oxidase [Acidobacteriaceae bacterium]